MSTPELHSLQCPDCAAPLRVPVGTRELTCTYCGHLILVTPPTEPSRVDRGGDAPMAPTAPKAPSAPMSPLVLPIVVAVLGGIAFGIYSMATAEHMQWSTNADGPFVVQVNDDAIEDLVGQHRVFEKAADGSSTSEYVGAFDGASRKLLWRAGPFGKSDALHFAVSGARVLATDDRHQARLFDMHTGKPTGSVALSDVAKRVCPTRAGFYVESIDGKGVLVDLDAHASVQVAPPECVRDERCEPTPGHFRQRSSGCRQEVPDGPDFMASKAVGDETTLVIVGSHRPGTQTPTVRVLDRASLAVRWSRPVASTDPTRVRVGEPKWVELRDGVVYTQYVLEGRGGFHVVAIDAATGKDLWDVLVPRSTEGGSVADELIVSSTRLYVPHWTWLDILDRKTGASIGTIGRW